jgi:hypothetical protein
MLILALIGLAALTEPALPHKRMDAAASPVHADDIAAFLSGANPHWSRPAVQTK